MKIRFKKKRIDVLVFVKNILPGDLFADKCGDLFLKVIETPRERYINAVSIRDGKTYVFKDIDLVRPVYKITIE